MTLPSYKALERKAFSFTRQITSFNSSLPSGTVEGTVQFLPSIYDDALLYEEKGTWYTDTNAQFQVSRYYLWHFQPDKLTLWFVKLPSRDLDTAKEKDYVFLELPFDSETLSGVHHCGKDVYRGDILFPTQQEFLMRYQVEGPEKQYTSDTLYTFSNHIHEEEHEII